MPGSGPRWWPAGLLALVLVAATAADQARAQALFPDLRVFARAWRAFRPPPVVEAPPGDDAPGEEPPLIALPIDGEHRRRLDQLREAIESGRQADAARQIGMWLQDPGIPDGFVTLGGESTEARGFKVALRALLGSLSGEVRAAYIAQFEPLARDHLTRALQRDVANGLRQVVTRFPFTPAAEEALWRLAHDHWDHGRPRAALACLARLRLEVHDPARFQPGRTLLACACRAACGAPELAHAELADLARDHPELDLAGAPLRSWLSSLAGGTGQTALPHRWGGSPSSTAAPWGVFGGHATRHRSVPVAEPFMAPRWTRALAQDPRALTALETVAEAHRAGRQTSLPMLAPLVAGDLLLVPTSRGVAAFDLREGACLWRVPSDDDGMISGLPDGLWREWPGGRLAADDQCVYLVERAGGDLRGSASVLVAREHAGGRQGKLRFRVGGGSGFAEPELAGANFLAAPVPWQQALCTVVELGGALRLVLLDAVTGRLEWSQELGTIGAAVADDPLRLAWGAMPSVSETDVVVCPTAVGAVVAVDLTTRSLLWAYRFARRAQHDEDFPAAERLPRHTQDDRWLDGAALILGDTVVLAPPESPELHGLELSGGRLLWKRPRADGLFVSGGTSDSLLVVGRSQLNLLRLADGQPVWPRPQALPAGVYPSGRGLSTGASYYLPVTTGSLLKIDLASGQIERELKPARGVALGNLVWHAGMLISLSATRLEVFDERAVVEEEVRRQMARDLRDPAGLIRQGELDLDGGRIDQALEAFRTAHARSGSAKARSRLIATLLDAVRHRHPSSRQFELELDQLASARPQTRYP